MPTSSAHKSGARCWVAQLRCLCLRSCLTAGVFSTTLRNFPDRKGTAVGIVKGWTGLGGGIFTQLYLPPTSARDLATSAQDLAATAPGLVAQVSWLCSRAECGRRVAGPAELRFVLGCVVLLSMGGVRHLLLIVGMCAGAVALLTTVLTAPLIRYFPMPEPAASRPDGADGPEQRGVTRRFLFLYAVLALAIVTVLLSCVLAPSSAGMGVASASVIVVLWFSPCALLWARDADDGASAKRMGAPFVSDTVYRLIPDDLVLNPTTPGGGGGGGGMRSAAVGKGVAAGGGGAKSMRLAQVGV